MLETKSSPFWGLIGKAGVLVGLTWGALQIYNNFFKTGDYESLASGTHSTYVTSPIHMTSYTRSAEYKALVKALIKRDGFLKDYNLDTLLKTYSSSPDFLNRIDFEVHYPNLNVTYGDDYKSFWTFQVKNDGNKPLEDLALELPFKGYCRILLPNNKTKDTLFSNKIELGDLRPSYELLIICWTDKEGYQLEDAETKSRFTHKNGWFSISYPAEVTGIYAWNKKNLGIPLIILNVLIVFAFMILYASGQISGYKKAKLEIVDKPSSDKPSEDKRTTDDEAISAS